MHDIKWIRDNPALFDAGLKKRGLEPQSEAVLELDTERRTLIARLQEVQSRRNALSKEIGALKQRSGRADQDALKQRSDPAKKNKKKKTEPSGEVAAQVKELMEEVASLKEEIAEGEEREREIDGQLRDLLAGIPNLPADDVPEGPDETANVDVRRWGEPRVFRFQPKQHFELGEALGLMDFEAAARLSGARFTVLKGGLARLSRALGQFMLDLHTGPVETVKAADRKTREIGGYTEVNPPLLVKDDAMFGTGQLPKFADDLFKAAPPLDITPLLEDIVDNFESMIPGGMHEWDFDADELEERGEEMLGNRPQLWLEHYQKLCAEKNPRWLIPTAEVSLTNLVREQILAEAELPLRFTALTPCFRAEAGAAGKDTRGMIRQHQFEKVELVSITTPEQSEAEHERMTACAEEVLRRLDLPFRTVLLCIGDMGFSARKTYDIEVWLPGQGAYREISSCSNCGDFQARRMNARYRPQGSKDTRFVHTLNGSGLAVGRTLIAVMENYQEADGSIRVPAALMPYMGGLEVIGRP